MKSEDGVVRRFAASVVPEVIARMRKRWSLESSATVLSVMIWKNGIVLVLEQ